MQQTSPMACKNYVQCIPRQSWTVPVTMMRTNANSFAYVKTFWTFIDSLTLIMFTAVRSTETSEHSQPTLLTTDNSLTLSLTVTVSVNRQSPFTQPRHIQTSFQQHQMALHHNSYFQSSYLWNFNKQPGSWVYETSPCDHAIRTFTSEVCGSDYWPFCLLAGLLTTVQMNFHKICERNRSWNIKHYVTFCRHA